MGWFMSADVPQKSMSLEREKQGKNFRYLWISFPQHKSFHPQYQQISLIRRISGPMTGYFHILPPPIPISVGLILHFSSQTRDSDKKKRNMWYGMPLTSEGWLLAQEIGQNGEWCFEANRAFFFTPMDSIHFNEFTHCLIVLSRKDPLKRRILLNRMEI